MKALIVGAGAVGMVYGRHLALSGAEVTFYVREKYRADAEAGFTVYPLNQGRDPVAFAGAGVISTLEEVGAQAWDQVWITVSATALRGDWLAPFVAALPREATVVAMQPGLATLNTLEGAGCAAERVVQGLIALISYQAPLPGEELPRPGIAYWLPPLSPSPFSSPVGDDERVGAVVSALEAGGCPAKRVADASVQAAFGSAVMMPHLVALELEGWSLPALRRGRWWKLAGRAAREALAVVEAEVGKRPGVALRAASQSWILRPVLCAAPLLMPLPLESYLKYHFTKVGDQTRFMMGEYVARGADHDLPTGALRELVEALKGQAVPA